MIFVADNFDFFDTYLPQEVSVSFLEWNDPFLKLLPTPRTVAKVAITISKEKRCK